jgi:hypothetical protein
MQNSFPMREWHIKHMEKLVIKFVTGLSESATNWEKRQNKRYGRISNVCRQIGYDIKQGAFSSLRKNSGSIERLNEVEKHFMPKEKSYSWV